MYYPASSGLFWQRIIPAAMVLLVCLCSPASASDFRTGILKIIRQSGPPAVFSVEIAESLNQRLRGLAYREDIAENHGMLFDFEEDTVMSMWMKNVPFPLDMVFINREGVIFHIVRNTEPYSETVHSSPWPGRFVLCVPAGSVSRLGIALLDSVKWPKRTPVTRRYCGG